MDLQIDEQILSVALRPHQIEAVEALACATDRFAYAEMSVASGKSLVMAALAQRALPRSRVLIIAHTEELVKQNAKACKWLGLPPSICSAGLGESAVFGRLTVGSVGTIANRLDYFKDVGVVIIDEVHRARMEAHKDGSASQYLQIKNTLPKGWFRGLTGTGWREDGTGSLENTFGKKVYSYGFLEALEDGYVKPLRAVAAAAPNIETKGLKTNSQGEWSGGELTNRGVALAPAHAAAFVEAMKEEGRTRALVFACDIAHANALESECKKLNVDARAVHTGNAGRNVNIEAFRRGEFPILISVSMFNCLDLETEILTADGWKHHDELTEADEVANWTPSGYVFFKKPKRIYRGENGLFSPMYAAHGDRHDMRVTSGHRIVYSSQEAKKDGSVLVKSAAELSGRVIQIPVMGHAEPFEITTDELPKRAKESRRRSLESYYRTRKGMSHAGAAIKAAEYHQRLDTQNTADPSALSLDECQFIGFWLGDGSSPRAPTGGLRWSAANFGILAWFDALVNKLGLHHTKSTAHPRGGLPATNWHFSTGCGNGAQYREGGIQKYTRYLNKKGSPLYRGFSRDQILALMHGFWLADGNHGPSGNGSGRGKRITGTQKELYDVLQSVLVVRGIDSSLTMCAAPKKENWAQTYSLSWNESHGGYRTMTLAPDAVSAISAEPIWCVESHSTFIITRRNGKIAVTGNTGFDVPDIDFIALCRPMKSSVLFAQSLGRGARLSEFANDCVVVDFGGNILRHGALDMIKPPKRRAAASGKIDSAEADAGEKLDSLERTVGGDLRMGAAEGSLLSRHGKPKWVKPIGSPSYLIGRHLWVIPTASGQVRWFSPSYPLDAQHLFCVYDARRGWCAQGAVDKHGVLHKA